MSEGRRGFVNFLQEFSIPLIGGVAVALVFANVAPEAYQAFVELGPLDALCAARAQGMFCMAPHGAEHAAAAHATIQSVFGLFGHHLTLHFLVNDIFMLLFFGIATKEITESILPGGALNPPSKAINPLMGTIGGVLGPIGVYLTLSALLFADSDPATRAEVMNGWGIPTATDIALAWLAARVVFGSPHPAVNFLLLLAIADDAIGLGIIAVFYPSQSHPPAPIWLLLVLAGMAIAYVLRRRGVRAWWPYVALGGLVAWIGLVKAALHPALALVPIIPFLPGPKSDTGLFAAADEIDVATKSDLISMHDPHEHSVLHAFSTDLKLLVDLGLFFFGLMNAGVVFSSVNEVTLIVCASLIIGKPLGITTFAFVANAVGFTYPTGMRVRHIFVAGIVASLGLTVALFVAGEAFQAGSPYQGPAKMGALASAIAAIIAVIAGRIFRVKQLEST